MVKLKSKILVIDDLPSNIEVLAELLKTDYEIIFATSGKKGIELATKEFPDLIILDVMMPEMDGFETCSQLKKSEITKSIPVMFVTALGEEVSESHGLEIGAIDYISKPINPEIVKTRVKNQIELQKTSKELELKNRELESFCFAVSHDLRAPLRRIQSFSQILAEDFSEKLDDSGRNVIEKICSGCAQMEDLISSLLRFSFISATEMKQNKFDLSKMAEEICNTLNEMEKNKNSEVSITPEMEITADSELIRVVMTNLLNNAWKFTGKKDKRIIQIGLTTKKGLNTYFVKDNGAGFDMKYAHKMFGVFQRLHAKTEFDGNGLGLFITQRIIEKHGGKIWAEGELNKGATFYFVLPTE
ncbi:MAG: response regulator [Candidatus Riflebacteria bacterium]|nr:response regulator [Candidatus Riflebacteria bacterium]